MVNYRFNYHSNEILDCAYYEKFTNSFDTYYQTYIRVPLSFVNVFVLSFQE